MEERTFQTKELTEITEVRKRNGNTVTCGSAVNKVARGSKLVAGNSFVNHGKECTFTVNALECVSMGWHGQPGVLRSIQLLCRKWIRGYKCESLEKR